MINKNKGEWSELYAMLRLLEQGRIYAADDKLNRLDDIYFPIIKIIRNGDLNRTDYSIDSNEGNIIILINDDYISTVPQSVFGNEADSLLEAIKAGGDRAFSIEKTERFMTEIGCERVAAPSSDKTDITMQIHDIQTGYSPICGFSIKSELGSAPTLLNASGATNFVFRVSGISDRDAEIINSITEGNKIRQRMSLLFEKTDVKFERVGNQVATENFMMIDSKMPEILAEALRIHYRDNIINCADVIGALELENPLGFPHGGFYTYKFKKFLCAVALGMTPSHSWDGRDEANGGYIVVTKKGSVLAYHIYNRDFFEEYLLNNTKFERASTTRWDYASVYKEDGDKFIKLNLQIRFR